MIYLLTAIGFTPGGNSTVHIYAERIHRTTQLNNRTTQLTIFADLRKQKFLGKLRETHSAVPMVVVVLLVVFQTLF
jgi:hypothetical protein